MQLSEAASVFCHIFRVSQHEILQFIGYLDDRVRHDAILRRRHTPRDRGSSSHASWQRSCPMGIGTIIMGSIGTIIVGYIYEPLSKLLVSPP